jgi:hypothetical protein
MKTTNISKTISISDVDKHLVLEGKKQECKQNNSYSQRSIKGAIVVDRKADTNLR